jgi:Flp pilus assembly pilin Flp
MYAVRRFLRDESAIAVTEYGLLVALVAVLLIGAVAIFGSSISSWFKAKTETITTA